MLGIPRNKQFAQPHLSSFAEHWEKAPRPDRRPLVKGRGLHSCPSLSLRPDLGPEDGDGQEGRAAVVHEDVHGLPEVLHLQDEVCLDKRWAVAAAGLLPSHLPLRALTGSARITH